MPSTPVKYSICALMSAVDTARWWTPLQRIMSGPPCPRILLRRRRQVPGLCREGPELAAVAVGIGAAAAVGDREDRLEARVARVLRVAEEHAELGDGGGELEVRRGRLERRARVDHRAVEPHAVLALR